MANITGASLYRALRSIESPYICATCRQARGFTRAAALSSGHNKWSSIKHDKARKDGAKNKQRSIISVQITNIAKFFGGDPASNPRLATAIDTAKKAGIPKTVIDTAVARGNGLSASGASLEAVNVEALFPPGIATIIECQTDNRLRTLKDVRLVVKQHNGTAGPTSYLFEKKGRIDFKRRSEVQEEELLEAALEAGALDVFEEEDQLVVFTAPENTKAVAEQVSTSLDLEIESTEIVWDPNKDTQVPFGTEQESENFSNFLEAVQGQHGVNKVYSNVLQDPAAGDELKSGIAS